MQSTVSCDRVFDALTGQPFPSGGEDDLRIEEHLRACHDCRRLAEALRPAVDLLHESLPHKHASHNQMHSVNRIGTAFDASQSALPTFSGFSDEDSAVDAIMSRVHATARDPESSSGELPPHNHQTTKPFASFWSPGTLAAFTAIAAAVMLMFALSQGSVMGDDETFANDSDRYAYLAGCGVPTACLSNVGWTTLTDQACDFAESATDKACCTECHNAIPSEAAEPHAPHPIHPKSVTLLAKSCRACHTAEP